MYTGTRSRENPHRPVAAKGLARGVEPGALIRQAAGFIGAVRKNVDWRERAMSDGNLLRERTNLSVMELEDSLDA